MAMQCGGHSATRTTAGTSTSRPRAISWSVVNPNVSLSECTLLPGITLSLSLSFSLSLSSHSRPLCRPLSHARSLSLHTHTRASTAKAEDKPKTNLLMLAAYFAAWYALNVGYNIANKQVLA